MRRIISSPCPWCGKKIDLTTCKSRRHVRGTLRYSHLYTGGLRPPVSRCKVKTEAMRQAGKVTAIKEITDSTENKWVQAAVKTWSRTSPLGTPLLTKQETRRRQVLAGRNQSIKDKRQGGLNQSRWSKVDGGIRSAHVRWHKTKTVSWCKWCSVPRPAEPIPPVTCQPQHGQS
jgi:hypothetical protein